MHGTIQIANCACNVTIRRTNIDAIFDPDGAAFDDQIRQDFHARHAVQQQGQLFGDHLTQAQGALIIVKVEAAGDVGLSEELHRLVGCDRVALHNDIDVIRSLCRFLHGFAELRQCSVQSRVFWQIQHMLADLDEQRLDLAALRLLDLTSRRVSGDALTRGHGCTGQFLQQ
ncbi:MAG: hypothetical protein BWZ07_02847 [Alphaproteobacteria bacterium ADurb.BinA280]|nr:MAG: hypothetical protein BWZ07_02847 [Alphaproteobacteria bacterium ADurb.BinA280]